MKRGGGDNSAHHTEYTPPQSKPTIVVQPTCGLEDWVPVEGELVVWLDEDVGAAVIRTPTVGNL